MTFFLGCFVLKSFLDGILSSTWPLLSFFPMSLSSNQLFVLF